MKTFATFTRCFVEPLLHRQIALAHSFFVLSFVHSSIYTLIRIYICLFLICVLPDVLLFIWLDSIAFSPPSRRHHHHQVSIENLQLWNVRFIFMICYIHLAKLSIFLFLESTVRNFSTTFHLRFSLQFHIFSLCLHCFYFSLLNAIVVLLSIFLQFILLPLPSSFFVVALFHFVFHSLCECESNLLSLSSSTLHFTALNSTNECSVLKANLTGNNIKRNSTEMKNTIIKINKRTMCTDVGREEEKK